MTMPHLTNCAHSGEGWCLECVQELYEVAAQLRQTVLDTNEETKTKMAIRLGYTDEQERIAKLENEIDVLQGRPPRNKYTCTVCHGHNVIDESYHGSPDFQPCSYCDSGRKVREANETLLKGKR